MFCFGMLMTLFLSLPTYADSISEQWQYTVSSGEATLTKYIGNSKSINIPSSIDGYPVTGIGKDLFYDSGITSLIIPSSIEKIDSRAFANCKYLTKIDFNAVDCDVYCHRSMMDQHIFINAGKFSDSLTVTFGTSVKKVPTCLFESSEGDYAHVTKVIISDSVEEISDWAFHNCFDLSDLKIGNGVLTIGQETFADCLKLSSLTIPKKVEKIGAAAFSNLKYLTTIDFNAVNCDVYYFRTMMDRHVFVNAGKSCGGLTVNFGSGVKKVPTAIFEAADNSYVHITEVNLPNSVTEIGNFAFNNCKDLRMLSVASKTTKFPTDSSNWSDAFQNCSSNLVFKCYRGSTAAEYAANNGFKISYYDPMINISKATVELAISKYVYNGKKRQPSISVSIGRTKLKANTDYSVSYKNNIAVGIATVTIIGKGDYTGSISKTYTILPKGTSILKLAAKSKGFSIVFKKQTTQTTGYQVQYSAKKKFSGAVAKTISKTSKGNVTYKKLKAKTKYYVRVRTYKKVSGTKYYSSWSSVKTVTTKK